MVGQPIFNRHPPQESVETPAVSPASAQDESMFVRNSVATGGLLPDAAVNLASRHNLALGDNSPGEGVIRAELMRDEGLQLRQSVASERQAAEAHRSEQAISHGLQSDNPQDVVEAKQIAAAGTAVVEPSTILELDFATVVMREQLNDPTFDPNDLNPQDRQVFEIYREGLLEFMVRDGVINTQLEKVQAIMDEFNFFEKGADFITMMLPFMSATRINLSMEAADTAQENAGFLEELLPGDTLSDQISALYLLPIADFEARVTEIVDELLTNRVGGLIPGSPLEAIRFLGYVLNWRQSDQSIENIFAGIDMAAFFTGGIRAAVAGTRTIAAVNRANRIREGLAAAGMSVDDIIAGIARDPNAIPWNRRFIEAQNTKVGNEAQAIMDRMTGGARTSAKPNSKPQDVAATVGDLPRAAILQLAEEATARSTTGGVGQVVGKTKAMARRTLASITRRLPSFANPLELMAGSKASFAPARNYTAWLQDVVPYLPPRALARTTEDQIQAGIPEAITAVTREVMRDIDNSIFMVTRNFAEDTDNVLLNVDTFDFWINRPTNGGEFFTSSAEASTYASKTLRLSSGSYEVVPPGRFQPGHVRESVSGTFEEWTSGWAIKITRPADETSPTVRNLPIASGNETRVPFLGALRSATEHVGRNINETRKSLEHYQTKFNEMIKPLVNVIEAMNKADRQGMGRFLRHVEQNALDPGLYKGAFVAPNEFRDMYHALYNVFPSTAQKNAYESWIRMRQLSWSLENTAVYRGKMRQGIQNIHILKADSKQGEAIVEGRTIASVDDMKVEIEPHMTIMLYNPDGTSNVVRWSNIAGKEQAKLIEDSLSTGKADLIRITNHKGNTIIRELGEVEPVDFILTKHYRKAPLDVDQIPWSPGGNKVLNHKFYVRQARTGTVGRKFQRDVDYGEVVVSSASSRKQALQFATDFNKAIDTYTAERKAGSATFPETRAYLHSTLSHVDPDDFITRLRNKEMHERHVVVVRQGESIRGSEHAQLLKNVHNLEENIDIGIGLGSVEKPFYSTDFEHALDPVGAMNRQLRGAMMTAHPSEMITRTAEQFVQEFKTVLNMPSRQLRDHPASLLLGGDDDLKFIKSSNPVHKDLIRRAQMSRKAARDMLGFPTKTHQVLRTLNDKLFESTYGTSYGNIRVGKSNLADIINHHLESTIKDGATYLRAVAFQAKLGLFNWTQLFKQSQTTILMVGATGNPVRAASSAIGAVLMMTMEGTGYSAKLARSMGKLSRGLGWKPEHFQEALSLIRDSGIRIVRGEHALKDNFLEIPTIGGKVTKEFSKALNRGTLFFDKGEGFNRVTALNIAYREWRKAHPNDPLRRADKESIMARSGALIVNMTHSANAQWQRGWTAFPVQFFTYQIRLMDLIFGKQLSKAEKARVIMVQSLVYGIPIGMGGTTMGIWPWGESYKEAMLRNDPNSVINPDYLDTMLSQGLLGVFFRGIAGGHETNISDLYGPHGLDLIKDLLGTDRTTREIFFGAAGSVFSEIWEDSYGFRTWFADLLFNEGGDQNTFDWSLVSEMFRSISAVNLTIRAAMMVNTQSFVRSNGDQPINPNTTPGRTLEPGEFWNFLILGVSPAEIELPRLIQNLELDFEGARKLSRERIEFYFKRLNDISSNSSLSQEERTQQVNEIYNVIKPFVHAGAFTDDELDGILSSTIRGMQESTFSALTQWAKSRGGLIDQEDKVPIVNEFIGRNAQ